MQQNLHARAELFIAVENFKTAIESQKTDVGGEPNSVGLDELLERRFVFFQHILLFLCEVFKVLIRRGPRLTHEVQVFRRLHETQFEVALES